MFKCRLYLIFILAGFAGFGYARETVASPSLGQPCITLDPQGTTLDIVGFGGALFGDFSFNSREDRAELFNSICLRGEEGWQLEAVSLQVDSLSSAQPTFKAQYGRLSLEDWRLAAADIVSGEGSLQLRYARFYNDTARGAAEQVRYNVETGEALLEELYAVAGNYRIEGSSGRLYENDLVIEDGIATTCLCDDKLYVVTAPEVSVDLLAERIHIQDGALAIGDTVIRLAPDLVLDEDSFKDFEAPISARYDGREDGNGLEILARLGLTEGTILELGVVGFAEGKQNRLFSVVKIDQPGVSATIGYAKDGGAQADIRFEQPLQHGFVLDFGLNNRYFASQNYLSEGYVGLSTSQTIDLYENARLSLTPRIFAALSGQDVGGYFISPRLGGELAGGFKLPSTFGVFGLDFNAQATTYPTLWSLDDEDNWQYGFYVKPSWSLKLADLQTRVSYERRWTNAASPFTTKLDRLSEASILKASVDYSRGDVADFDTITFEDRALVQDNFAFGLTANTVYDFLKDPETQNPLRRLNFGVTSDWRYEQIFLDASLKLETAALFSDVYDDNVEAYIDGSVTSTFSSGMAFGLRSKYYLEAKQVDDVAQPLLDVLELNALYPLHFGDFVFEPYIGFDFASLFNQTGGLGISSHGLLVRWGNCCGTLSIGYRQVDNITDVTLSVSVDSDRRPEIDPEEFANEIFIAPADISSEQDPLKLVEAVIP